MRSALNILSGDKHRPAWSPSSVKEDCTEALGSFKGPRTQSQRTSEQKQKGLSKGKEHTLVTVHCRCTQMVHFNKRNERAKEGDKQKEQKEKRRGQTNRAK